MTGAEPAPHGAGFVVTMYRYGVASRLRHPDGSHARVDFDAEALHQLRLAHDLRNGLVEIELRSEEQHAAVWLTRPEVAAARAVLDQADAAVEQASAEVRAWRSEHRSPRPPAEVAEPLTAARHARRGAKAAHRATMDAAHAALAGEFHELYVAKRTAIRALYAEFVTTERLYWATFNDVVANHWATAKRIRDQRKLGRPANFRFARWTGEGTLTVQLQREADNPIRSPDLLSSGTGRWRYVIDIPPLPAGWEQWTRAARAAWLATRPTRLRIGSGELRRPVWLGLLVVWHRRLPAAADVTHASVTRRIVGGTPRLTVAFTMRLPAPAAAHRPGTIGLDIGFRSLGGGLG